MIFFIFIFLYFYKSLNPKKKRVKDKDEIQGPIREDSDDRNHMRFKFD